MKKAKPVRYDEIEGKVVSGAGYGWNTMLIAFTDGTVLALTADDGHAGPEIDFMQGEDIIDLQSINWSGTAYEAGLISREEFAESRDENNARRIAHLEHELASLKELTK